MKKYVSLLWLLSVLFLLGACEKAPGPTLLAPKVAVEITCTDGDDDCYVVDGNTVIFTGISQNSAYSISGEIVGSIVIDVGDDYDFELELQGLTLTSETECPITILSGNKVKLSAQEGYENFIYDKRAAVSEEESAGAIHSECDLVIGGKGSLSVVSDNNNGIHSKDDLEIKKLTLYVSCMDNALKGNDSVEVSGGSVTLLAKQGDGIKTSNSDISDKGNQRGSVTLSACTVDIHAACDGIDAAYDVIIADSAAVLNICTGKYCEYAEQADQNSAMGMKADNTIRISGGTIAIQSSGDAIHAAGGTSLENGQTGKGNVTILDGSVTLKTDDDGIHADGNLEISGGTIAITDSYEGVEGSTVTICGGSVSVISADDGINATAASGQAIVISGGYLYIHAGGDGMDSNSLDSYNGIVFSGGKTVVITASESNSAIDTEGGYQYTGGYVLAVTASGRMSGEAMNCQNFSSVGRSQELSLSNGTYLTVSVDATMLVTVQMPCSMQAIVVFLGSPTAQFATSDSETAVWNRDGICWTAGNGM